jgi:lambda family phage tail tape measure protein
MANMIARLGVLLGIDSAEFKRGIDEASKKLEQFADAAEKYGKIAATSLVAAGVAALKYADDIADVATANDVAIDSILKLREALAQNGGEAENASKLMSSFNNFVTKAADGSFDAQRSFKTLGISLQDISRMSIDELFSKTAQGLADIEDPILRNARAFEIYGKAAKGVDFVGFNQTLSETNAITERQAQAVQDAADMYDKLQKHARDTALVIATELGPPLKATSEYFESMTSKGNIFADTLKVTYQTIAVIVSDVAFIIKGISDELNHTVENAKVLATQGIEAAKKLNAEYDKYREDERTKLDEFQRRIMGGGGGYGGGTSKFDDPRRLDKSKENIIGRTVKPGIDQEAERIRRENQRILDEKMRELASMQKTNLGYEERQHAAEVTLEKEQEIFKLEMNSRFYKKEDLTLEREIIDIRAKAAENIYKLEQETNLTKGDKADRISKENELMAKSIELAKERNRLTKEYKEGDIFVGIENKMTEYMNNMKTQIEIGGEMFTSVMSSMESALDRFVANGKLSFKDLTKSILQDLLRIQMRAQISGLFSGLFKSMGFGGGGAGTSMSQFEYAMVSGFADGGEPPVNQISLVGERGPELFIPKTAGTIIPNNALSSIGGTTNVTNNYINAIDAKSFEQRLLESNQAIWSANQYASKNLSTNFGRT